MKTSEKLYIAIALSTFLIALLLMAGCASAPPTAFEQRMFDIQTNYTPQVVVRTNIIPVTVVQTNTVTVTNVQGVVEFRTNLVPVFNYQTNVVTVTNQLEAYVYKPGAGAQEIAQTGGAVGNIFGAGGLVSTGVMALFSLWGYMRSRKSYTTAANIAQTVETMREFIKQLPNGAQYDNELVNWMQTNQANAGVLQQVIALIGREVSNPDAKEAARNISTLIAGLQGGTKPPA